MNQKLLIAGFGVALMMAGCGAKQVKLSADNRAFRNGIAVEAEWVKDKGKKFDVRLIITNETKKDVLVAIGDLSCARGEAQGEIKYTFAQPGEHLVDIRPGRAKGFLLVCHHGKKAKGFYKVHIGRVFDNPGGDGATRGAVLVTDLVWSAPDGGA